jgi:hypothetical protein
MNGPGRVGLGVEVRNDDPANAVTIGHHLSSILTESFGIMRRSVIDLDRVLRLAYAPRRASDNPHGSASLHADILLHSSAEYLAGFELP